MYQPNLPKMLTFHVNDDSTIYDDNSVGNSSGINHSKAKGASSVIINGTQKIDDDNASLGGDLMIIDADNSIEDDFFLLPSNVSSMLLSASIIIKSPPRLAL